MAGIPGGRLGSGDEDGHDHGFVDCRHDRHMLLLVNFLLLLVAGHGLVSSKMCFGLVLLCNARADRIEGAVDRWTKPS